MKYTGNYRRISLSRRILLYLLGVAFLSVISLGSFWISDKLKDYQKEIRILKNSYSDTRKSEIKHKILQIKDYIQWAVAFPENPVSQTLVKEVNNLKPALNDTRIDSSMSDSDFRKLLNASLEQTHVPIYILNKSGKIILSYNPFKMPGPAALNDNEIQLLKQIQTKKNHNGVVKSSKTDDEDRITTSAIGYYNQQLKPGFTVVSIIDSPNFDAVLQVHILDTISQLRFSTNEYVFINTLEGQALVTNGKYNKTKTDILKSGNKAWIDIFRVQQSSASHPNGVFHTYQWPKLAGEDLAVKTSYFSYVPRWKWIIGTGFYEDEINAVIESKKEGLYRDLLINILKVLAFVLFSAMLSYLIARFFSKRLQHNIYLFNDFFEKAAEQNILIDKSQISYVEFDNMAEAANLMVEERKLSENALIESEAHYRYLFERNPVPMLVYELGSLKILSVNHAFMNHYGYSPEEIDTMLLTDLYPDNEKEAATNLTISIKGLAYAGEWHHIKKDGTQITIEAHSHEFSFEGRSSRIAVIYDITDRKKAEDALRISEERYRLISNVVSDYVFTSQVDNNNQLVLTWVTGAFEKITGYTLEEYQKMGGWRQTLHPDDVGKDNYDFEQLNNNRQIITEIRTFTKTGRLVWVRAYAHPVWDTQLNKLVGIYGAVQDITEKKKAEEDLHQLNLDLENRITERTLQLKLSNKELESFSYSISHDLRAPLRAIYGFSQILSTRHRESLNQEGRQYMDYIVEASIRMEQLINDLLNYSRLGRSSLDLHPVAISNIIVQIQSDFNQQLQEIGAQVNVQDNLPMISGDESLFMQIFTNLVGNAITYRRVDVPLVINITCETQYHKHTLKINDNGIGIPKEHWEKIFNVFQRLHSNDKYSGTGIGLATVSKAVSLLGGLVWVESVVDEGSTFFIEFHENKK